LHRNSELCSQPSPRLSSGVAPRRARYASACAASRGGFSAGWRRPFEACGRPWPSKAAEESVGGTPVYRPKGPSPDGRADGYLFATLPLRHGETVRFLIGCAPLRCDWEGL
jgi:hypothetical protein